MILKLGPLLDINFKSKAQLHFVHMKDCEIVVTVSWDFFTNFGFKLFNDKNKWFHLFKFFMNLCNYENQFSEFNW
jgi:hypothetical protein